MRSRPVFRPGKNVAMKVPPDEFDATVAFYRDIVGLKRLRRGNANSVGFEFGGKNLWIDRVPALSQAEIWLEISTRDTKAAAQHLKTKHVVRADAIEPLPADLDAFWIKNPAGIVHLVCND